MCTRGGEDEVQNVGRKALICRETGERVRGIEPPLSAWELQGRLIAPCLSWAFGLLGCPLVRLVDEPLLDLMARIWHALRPSPRLRQA